ncbi:hypothetical protein [Leisingera sp. McT4-56]|uniref:hypothetical protein n=1 Tax=Leisingera sp. McT4-56 TaxID=2881255 RepID=UPI001CF8E5DD|nr:hypothetical protein [Leisingera sp. McT4-56]MCB4455828.1 hypothetical protein [Leisingera sp. McT4-56]
MIVDTSAISPKHLSYLQAAYPLTSTDRAKQLLARILFWVPMATIERTNQKWVAKSRKEWAKETGLTFIQVKKALKDLRDAHLIDTGQFIFGSRNTLHTALSATGAAIVGLLKGVFSRQTTYSSLPAEDRESLRSRLTSLLSRPIAPSLGDLSNCFTLFTSAGVPDGSTEGEPDGSTGEVPDGSTLYTIDNTKTAEDIVKAPSELEAPKEQAMPNVEDTLKGMFQNQDTPEKAASKTPRQHFMQWWRFWWHTQFGSQIGPFTSVEMGKVGHIVTRLGMDKATEEQCGTFVEVLFKRWTYIADAVQDQKGYKQMPTRPDLGIILVNAYIVRDAVVAQSGKKGSSGTPTIKKPSKGLYAASKASPGGIKLAQKGQDLIPPKKGPRRDVEVSKKGKIFDMGAGMQKYGSPYLPPEFGQAKATKLTKKAVQTFAQ